MADNSPTPEIISRKEAKAKGLKRYFTGKPCKHGHIAERYVGDKACIICKTTYRTTPDGIKYHREYNRHRYNNDPTFREPCLFSIKKYQARPEIIQKKREYDKLHAKIYRTTDKGKEAGRAGRIRRRARILGNGGYLLAKDLLWLRNTQKHCYLCSKKFTKNDPATIEHIIPLSKGGTNDITNIMLAHRSCNDIKKNKILQLL